MRGYAYQAIGLAIHPWSVLGFGIGVIGFFFLYPLLLLALERVPAKYYVRYLLMFVFGPTWSSGFQDIIWDFEDGVEKIDLTASGLTFGESRRGR